MKSFNPYDLNDVANMDKFIDESHERMILDLYKKWLYPEEKNNKKPKIKHEGILKLIKKKNKKDMVE